MQKSDNKTQLGIPTNHLLTYYYRLRKHKWLIVGTVFLTVFFSALFSLTMEPVFQSSSTIIIEEEQQESPLTGQRLSYENQFSQQLTFQTHFEMITSRPVLAKTLQNLGLKEESLKPSPIKKFISSVKSNLSSVISIFSDKEKESQEEPVANEETLLSYQITALADKLSIGAVRGTRLLAITAEDNDPVIARNIANVLAETYILYDSEVRLASSQKMITWLNSQLYEMKKKVEEAERVFLEFKEQSGLFSLEGKKQVSSQKMTELNTAFVKASAERLAVEAKIKELIKIIDKSKGQVTRSVPGFMQNPFLNDLVGKLSFAEVELKKIQGVYKPKHPEYIKAAGLVKELRSKVQDQFQKALDNLRAERSVALAQENAAKRAIENTETESMDTNRKEVQYSILEREVQTNRELYNTLLTRMKEAKVTDEITSTNLRLVGPAALPTDPVRPKKAFNILVGLLVGLSLGVGMALLLEYFDQTVHNKEDAEQHFQMPVLAEIPLAENGIGKDKGYISPSLLEMPMNSLFAESYRVLSNSLMYSRLNREGGMFVVTSASPGEGKSTISFNLGLTLSLQGLRVVVVETDMRLPASRREPALKGRAGLADILSETFSTEIKDGQLGELSVVDIHALLEVQEKSGVLNYWNDEHKFTVYFLRGQIIDVDWPTRPPEERLGELLVRSGLLTREQLNVALSRQKATSGRLGRVLINLGLITIDKVAGPLKLLTQENLRALYRLKSAHFSFEEKDSRNMINQYGPKEADLNSTMGKIEAGKQIPSKFLIDQLRRHLIQIKGTSLSLLLAGSTVPNPGALLSSNRMRFLVDLLSEEFDVVLFDSPPAGTISDSGAVATLSDGVIFVIRAGYARLGEIKRAQEHTTSVQTPIVGTVINAMDIRREPYYDTQYYSKYNRYYISAGDGAKHPAKRKARPPVPKKNGDKSRPESGKA